MRNRKSFSRSETTSVTYRESDQIISNDVNYWNGDWSEVYGCVGAVHFLARCPSYQSNLIGRLPVRRRLDG